MQSDPIPKSAIEELKAAGEELKKAQSESKLPKKEPPKVKVKESQPERRKQVIPDAKKGWVLPEVYQKIITDEKERLERAQKRIAHLQKSVQERLDKVKAMEAQNEKLDKELKEFQQKIVSIKKENNDFIYRIKNNIKENGN